ncbi:MAG: hypothetical protein A2137_06400 [Chloroflexi bacterium RBG_16_58_8]|nr:MAG: hypothetical protein A2137_06400 [Chloroflexi bacterium RBG_16_58_8]
MAAAFFAGVAVTAALAQTPLAASIPTPALNHDSRLPAPPETPGFPRPGGRDTHPDEYPIKGLVYASWDEALVSG